MAPGGSGDITPSSMLRPVPEAERDAPSKPDPDPTADQELRDLTRLAAGFVAGDPSCLEESFRRWSPLVFTVANNALRDAEDAKDVTQQVFVGAWRSRSDFDPERGRLPAWLIGITRHRIVDRQRARNRERRLVGAVEQEVTSESDESVTDGVDRLVLTAELERLAHPRGTILRLAFWEGRTYPEIAERLELPLGTVKSHARRGLLHLRARLEEVTSWPT